MIDQLPTVDTLLGDPAFVLALSIVILVGYHYIARMPYSEFVLATQLKHRLAAITGPYAQSRGLRIVTTKQYREDDEYVATVGKSPRQLATAFKSAGINQHLIAGSKRRETPDGLQWSHTQWTYQHDDGRQTEVWVYPNGNGSTDIYAHREASVFDPDDHLSTPFDPGDPAGVLDGIVD